MTEETIIEGVVEGFFETGTEGVIWSVFENGKTGYDGLHEIYGGDHLTIWNHDGSIAFDDTIVVDGTTGYEPYPLNPQYGQQVALGMWVHWVQAGMDPDAWGTLFMEEPPRRARLVRADAGGGYIRFGRDQSTLSEADEDEEDDDGRMGDVSN